MIALVCEDHAPEIRWVVNPTGATHGGGRSSYHFQSEALDCPVCGRPGEIQMPEQPRVFPCR